MASTSSTQLRSDRHPAHLTRPRQCAEPSRQLERRARRLTDGPDRRRRQAARAWRFVRALGPQVMSLSSVRAVELLDPAGVSRWRRRGRDLWDQSSVCSDHRVGRRGAPPEPSRAQPRLVAHAPAMVPRRFGSPDRTRLPHLRKAPGERRSTASWGTVSRERLPEAAGRPASCRPVEAAAAVSWVTRSQTRGQTAE